MQQGEIHNASHTIQKKWQNIIHSEDKSQLIRNRPRNNSDYNYVQCVQAGGGKRHWRC